MKKIIALMLSVATVLAFVPQALALDAKAVNYIYADSLDDVDWDDLAPNDVVLIPNENLPADELNNASAGESLVPEQSLPGSVSLYENSAPTAVWNVAQSGQYDFKGYTYDSSYLYTNYNFTGKSSYRVKITNLLASDTLTAKVRGSWDMKNYRTIEIVGGVTAYFSLGSNDGISSSTKWLLRFNRPVNTEGYVS